MDCDKLEASLDVYMRRWRQLKGSIFRRHEEALTSKVKKCKCAFEKNGCISIMCRFMDRVRHKMQCLCFVYTGMGLGGEAKGTYSGMKERRMSRSCAVKKGACMC